MLHALSLVAGFLGTRSFTVLFTVHLAFFFGGEQLMGLLPIDWRSMNMSLGFSHCRFACFGNRPSFRCPVVCYHKVLLLSS